MGKFTAIQTYDRFLKLWGQHKVNDHSLNFILDTGQLYTHGIFLNSVAYGAEANGAVPLTIAGTSKTLSLGNHTHSTYLEKNANINLGSYKIVSGQKDLLYYSGGNTYLGNTTSPAVILGTNLSTVRNNTTYTVLDTSNFSIGNTTAAGYTLLNVAVFKYGSSSFQLDYVKRVNTSSTFDALAAYTSVGTTQVNNKLYGVITLYTDSTILNPSWAQFRVDIADQLVLFRTSKDSTKWVNLNQIDTPLNALNVAGSVAAPTSTDANKVWKTDGSGNPAWRTDSGNTWRNIRINDEESDSLGTRTGTGALYIKQGTGITVSWSGNKIVIANSAPDTWKAANSLQEGYVPKLNGSGTISTQASEYVLTYTSGSGTITPTWKLLPSNAFNNTWIAANKDNAGYVPKSVKGKFLHARSDTGALEWTDDNNTWKAVSTSLEGYAPLLATNGESILSSDVAYVLAYRSGRAGVTYPLWILLPANAYNNTWIAWAGATSSNGGTAGYMPAPGIANYQKFLRGDGTWCSLSTPDDIATLTRASGNLNKDEWSDVGTFADTVAEGTWVISFTVDGSLYSGVFSRKKGDTMLEEINLHAAGTSSKRIYARTNGNKVLIVTSDTTFNPGAITFNFRKLI